MSTIINGIGRVGIRTFVPTPNPLWNNLKAYYTGDNTPNDAKGTYNGTLVNGTTYATGKINNGFSFDGINDYVSLPSGMFNPSGSFTISAWFNITSLPTLKYIIKIGNFLDNSICVYVRSTATTFLVANASDYQVIDAPLPVFNTFNHVVCVKNTVSNKYLIYFNGVLASQPTIAINHSLPNLTTQIGAYNFPGIIDEVGLWDGKALTASEVTELYNAGNGKQYPN